MFSVKCKALYEWAIKQCCMITLVGNSLYWICVITYDISKFWVEQMRGSAAQISTLTDPIREGMVKINGTR